MTTLPTWDEQMEALKGVADHLLATWRPENASEAEVQDMNKLALSILACGYLCHVYTDARRPVFMPLWNYACNQGGPNPDYVYLNAEVDGSGVYELTGRRGTVRFVEITQSAPGMMKSLKGVERQDEVSGHHSRPRRPDHRRRRLLPGGPQRRASCGPRR